jgi:hypothetical protein
LWRDLDGKAACGSARTADSMSDGLPAGLATRTASAKDFPFDNMDSWCWIRDPADR